MDNEQDIEDLLQVWRKPYQLHLCLFRLALSHLETLLKPLASLLLYNYFLYLCFSFSPLVKYFTYFVPRLNRIFDFGKQDCI